MTKKLLFLFASAVSSVIGMAQDAAETPAFPETLDVSSSVQGIAISQGEEQGVLTVKLSGMVAQDVEAVDITVAVPEGWDGIIGVGDWEITDTGIDQFKTPKTAALDDDENWVPLEFLEEYGMTKGNKFLFPVDGDYHMGSFMLYKGEYAYYVQIQMEGTFYKAPVFPESIEVTVPRGVTVQQQYAPGEGLLILLGGESVEDEVSASFKIPEGWEGFIGMSQYELLLSGGTGGIEWSKTAALSDEEEPLWGSVKEMLSDPQGGLKKTNTLKFLADDGEEEWIGYLYLYVGDYAYQIPIYVEAVIEKVAELTPIYPEQEEVKAAFEFAPAAEDVDDANAVEINHVFDEEIGMHTISVGGLAVGDNVVIKLTVPQDWDGYLAFHMPEGEEEMPFEPLMTLKTAASDIEWENVNEMLAGGLEKVTELSYPTDGKDHGTMLYLYKGEKAHPTAMLVTANVTKTTPTGVANIAVEATDSYTVYSIDGRALIVNGKAERLNNLDNGIYIINGKKAVIRK